MASKPPDPRKTTGSTKRFKEDLSLAQHVLKARVALDKASEALNAVLQMVIERQGEEEIPSPPSGNTPLPQSSRPTRLDMPAWSSDAFLKHVRGMWSKAKDDKQREAVKDLVKKGMLANIIPQLDGERLDAEFKESEPL